MRDEEPQDMGHEEPQDMRHEEPQDMRHEEPKGMRNGESLDVRVEPQDVHDKHNQQMHTLCVGDANVVQNCEDRKDGL